MSLVSFDGRFCFPLLIGQYECNKNLLHDWNIYCTVPIRSVKCHGPFIIQ